MALTETTGPVLTEAELAHFRASGYLVVERITSPADVAAIRAVLESLFETKAGYKEGAHFNFAGPDDEPGAPSLPQIIAPHNYAENLRKTEFYRNAFAVARQLLGPEVRFASDHTLMKPAIDGPATPWHQDEAFRNPNYEYHEVSLWMPLQPVDRVNGCMEFIPGSHLGEVVAHRSPNNDPRIHVLEACEGFDPADAVVCPLAAGGCTIHQGRTLHASGPNRSNAPRYAYVLSFAIPPVPARKPRTFAWLQEQDTARSRRMKAWLRRGGVFIEAWRMLKRTEPRDYGKIIPTLKRKAGNMLQSWRNKKSGGSVKE